MKTCINHEIKKVSIGAKMLPCFPLFLGSSGLGQFQNFSSFLSSCIYTSKMISKQIKTTFKLGIKIKTCLNLIKTRIELKLKQKFNKKKMNSLVHPHSHTQFGLKFPPDPIQNWHPSHLVQGNSLHFSSLEKWMP